MSASAPKKFLGYLVNIIAVVLIAFGVRYFLSTSSPTPTGQIEHAATHALFAANFPDTTGKLQALSQWKGKILVVNFWATWCPPCLEEMPELSRLQTAYRNSGVVVLGISTDEVDKIREFSSTIPVTYPLLSGNIEAMDLGSTLGNDKGVLPYTVIINTDGNIAQTYFGQVNRTMLEQAILPLIQVSKKLPGKL